MARTLAAQTIAAALSEATARLAAAAIDTPRLDAELLLADVLAVERAWLVLDAARPLDPGASARFQAAVARRAAREPVAYIVGHRHFRHLTLAVDPRVLVPRPETELLVEVALALPAGARVLDVGTGSGAVALALAGERPDLEVWASDVSEDALAVARANAARLGPRVRFVRADLLTGVPGRFDAVLANLPYVADGASVAAEVERFEPAGAVFGGPDGLTFIRRLVAQLGSTPFVALEIGFDQAEAVAALLLGAGFAEVERHRDLAGVERVLVGRRA